VSKQSGRLVFIRVLVKLMIFVAIFAFLRILFGSLPERDAVVEPVVARYSVSDMKPGDYQLVEWNNKPLFIVYRKSAWDSQLGEASGALYRDPHSERSEQPDDARNALRSPYPGWFVTLGLGTGAGCALTFDEPVNTSQDTVSAQRVMAGGFTDGCDKSRYDMAGRVYVDQAAKRNTVVPQWRLQGQTILVSG